MTAPTRGPPRRCAAAIVGARARAGTLGRGGGYGEREGAAGAGGEPLDGNRRPAEDLEIPGNFSKNTQKAVCKRGLREIAISITHCLSPPMLRFSISLALVASVSPFSVLLQKPPIVAALKAKPSIVGPRRAIELPTRKYTVAVLHACHFHV